MTFDLETERYLPKIFVESAGTHTHSRQLMKALQ